MGNSYYTPPKALERYKNYFLPAMGVIETIATKGKSPGLSALNQQGIIQGGIDRQQDLGRQRFQDEEKGKTSALSRQLTGLQIGAHETKAASTEATQSRLDGYRRAVAIAAKANYGSDPTVSEQARNEAVQTAALNFMATEDPAKFLDYQAKMSAAQSKQSVIAAKPTPAEADVAKLDLHKRKLEQTATAIKKLPAGQVKELGEKRSSLEMLDNMLKKAETSKLNFQPSDKLRALNPWDPEAKSFEQLVQTTKQVIGKGLEGGVLRKEDEIKYEKILPKLGDTWEVLIKKANNLKQMLIINYNATVKGYADGGYLVDNFTAIEFEEYSGDRMTPEFRKALNWAIENPDDPDAPAVLERIGVK